MGLSVQTVSEIVSWRGLSLTEFAARWERLVEEGRALPFVVDTTFVAAPPDGVKGARLVVASGQIIALREEDN